MFKKRVLFNGCSFTAECGFQSENQSLFHWPWLISHHYDWYFANVAIGGSSNDEIFYRTLENYQLGQYDLYVIMWSGLSRKWIYHSKNNVDDFTVMNAGNADTYRNRPEVIEYAKLHYSYFDNRYVDLKKWLLQVKHLHDFFTAVGQKYVFLKGFDNLISHINQASYVPGQGFLRLSRSLKRILDFDNRPDYYINLKLANLQILLHGVKKCHWIGFDDPSFKDSSLDYADDRSHPGIKSNAQFAKKFIECFDRNYGQI